MGRIADSTIKGFMYQFNLSLNEILKSTNAIIKIEGIIEENPIQNLNQKMSMFMMLGKKIGKKLIKMNQSH